MTEEELFYHAWSAKENATLWKSRYKVGCAIQTKSGRVVCGWNIDGSWGTTIHAEVCAISKLTGLKEKAQTIAIVAEADSFTPCGACLDWLLQFSTEDAILITQNKKKYISRYLLKDLYPNYPKR